MDILLRYSFVLIIFLGGTSTYSRAIPQCPKLDLIGPAGILSPGETAEFQIAAKNVSDLNSLEVKWTVSVGTIVKGSGTPKIIVSIPAGQASGNFRVTAAIANSSLGCRAMLSDVWEVRHLINDPIFDSFGRARRGELQARIDNLFTQLSANPNSEGIFVSHFSEKASATYKTSRIKLFLQCIKYRKYDLTRVSFYFDSERRDEETWLVIVVLGTDLGFDPLKLIKAEEIGSKLKTLFH